TAPPIYCSRKDRGLAASVDLLIGSADLCLMAALQIGHLALLVLHICVHEAIGEPASYDRAGSKAFQRGFKGLGKPDIPSSLQRCRIEYRKIILGGFGRRKALLYPLDTGIHQRGQLQIRACGAVGCTELEVE